MKNRIKTRCCLAMLAFVTGFFSQGILAASELKDLDYGSILYRYHQKQYFDSLVTYAVEEAKGGIENHGDYPTLLKGGISLSYGLERRARSIFEQVLTRSTEPSVRNRAWFYLAKLLHQRGDTRGAMDAISRIQGAVEDDIKNEYLYLHASLQLANQDKPRLDDLLQEVDDDSRYAPYLYYNLGVNTAKHGDYERAIDLLEDAGDYKSETPEMRHLSDRIHLAAGQIHFEHQQYEQAFAHFERIHTSGIYSNKALLAYSWAVIEAGQLHRAVAPLQKLSQRTLAVPEVQEAIAMEPSIYEQLGAPRLAVHGFEQAVTRYEEGLAMIDEVAALLEQDDVLELFVSNLDAMMAQTDWFATEPHIRHNDLSPFIVQWMADHTFQAILKDLGDLYTLRNNLQTWERQSANFEIIMAARADRKRRDDIDLRVDELEQMLQAYRGKFKRLDEQVAQIDDRKQRRRILWLRQDVQQQIDSIRSKINLLATIGHPEDFVTEQHADVGAIRQRIQQQLDRTEAMIGKVEEIVRRLIEVELDIHRTRIKHYLVQSRLAMARLYDKALIAEMAGDTAPFAPAGIQSGARSNSAKDIPGDGEGE